MMLVLLLLLDRHRHLEHRRGRVLELRLELVLRVLLELLQVLRLPHEVRRCQHLHAVRRRVQVQVSRGRRR